MASVGAIDGMLLRRSDLRAAGRRESGRERKKSKGVAAHEDEPTVLRSRQARTSIPSNKTRADVR
jgi:hypothetical protein